MSCTGRESLQVVKIFLTIEKQRGWGDRVDTDQINRKLQEN